MNEQHITQSLHDIAQRDVEKIDLWPAIRQRIQPKQATKAHTRFVPTTRLGWATIAVMFFLAASTGAYATSTIVSQLFRTDGGLEYIDVSGFSHEINMSQTVDGVTVNVERAYADTHRIVVAFTTQSTDGKRYVVNPILFAGTNGTSFRQESASGRNIAPEDMQGSTALLPGEGGMVYSFFVNGINGSPSALNVRLVLTATDERSMTLPEEGIGPFTFEFSMPFTTGRTVEVDQMQQADGTTATLKRITIAPSGTTAVVCLDSVYKGPDWHLDAQLQLADGRTIRWNEVTGVEREGCYGINFNEALVDASGTWTLSMTTLEGISGWWPKQRGPWTFTCDVPQQ
jgi:hypothetical protein